MKINVFYVIVLINLLNIQAFFMKHAFRDGSHEKIDYLFPSISSYIDKRNNM
jgi:hypothetical protein